MLITGVIEPCYSASATRSWSTPKADCFVWRGNGDGTLSGRVSRPAPLDAVDGPQSVRPKIKP